MSEFEFLSVLVSIIFGLFDILQTAMREDLLQPWYYLPFVGPYIVYRIHRASAAPVVSFEGRG